MANSGWNNVQYVCKHGTYKHVFEYRDTSNGDTRWMARMRNPKTGSTNGKYYTTDKDAAKAVDMFRINIGLEPVNILKKA